MNLAVVVRNPATGTRTVRFGWKVRRAWTGSWGSAGHASSPLEDLIAQHLDMLFPGMDIPEHHLFPSPATRDLEVEGGRRGEPSQGPGQG